MSGRTLRVALPWLDRALLAAVPPAGPPCPATQWLLARGRRGPDAPDWREWLLERCGLEPDPLRRFPAGPCVRAACTRTRPAGSWACAAPVHLAAALDHLRLAAPGPLPLGAEESRELVSDLNARLAGRGFTLHESHGTWMCECPGDLDCRAAPPADSVGCNLRERMPAGRDAARVITWVAELQMALHGHPVNERRVARGLPAVNSVWLWGFGTAGPAEQGRLRDTLVTDDDWLAGLWRLHGAEPAGTDRLDAVLAAGDAATTRIGLAAMPSAADASVALQALERRLSVPLRAALAAGSVTGVSLLCGSLSRELGRGARWQVWRRERPLAELLP